MAKTVTVGTDGRIVVQDVLSAPGAGVHNAVVQQGSQLKMLFHFYDSVGVARDELFNREWRMKIRRSYNATTAAVELASFPMVDPEDGLEQGLIVTPYRYPGALLSSNLIGTDCITDLQPPNNGGASPDAMIEVVLPAAVTAALSPGTYVYDIESIPVLMADDDTVVDLSGVGDFDFDVIAGTGDHNSTIADNAAGGFFANVERGECIKIDGTSGAWDGYYSVITNTANNTLTLNRNMPGIDSASPEAMNDTGEPTLNHIARCRVIASDYTGITVTGDSSQKILTADAACFKDAITYRGYSREKFNIPGAWVVVYYSAGAFYYPSDVKAAGAGFYQIDPDEEVSSTVMKLIGENAADLANAAYSDLIITRLIADRAEEMIRGRLTVQREATY